MIERELTLGEVAERLRMKPITLRRFLRQIEFQAIQGGDTLLFTEADYLIIREARRKCRSRSSRIVDYSSASAAPSEPSLAVRAQKLRTKRKHLSVHH